MKESEYVHGEQDEENVMIITIKSGRKMVILGIICLLVLASCLYISIKNKNATDDPIIQYMLSIDNYMETELGNIKELSESIDALGGSNDSSFMNNHVISVQMLDSLSNMESKIKEWSRQENTISVDYPDQYEERVIKYNDMFEEAKNIAIGVRIQYWLVLPENQEEVVE